jgi:hypothetical protein
MAERISNDDLDLLLDEWTTPGASRGLHERIVASASARPARHGVWWAGAAGLGLAGAIAGAVIAAMLAPIATGRAPAPAGLEATSFASGATVFGDLDDGSES